MARDVRQALVSQATRARAPFSQLLKERTLTVDVQDGVLAQLSWGPTPTRPSVVSTVFRRFVTWMRFGAPCRSVSTMILALG